MKFRALVSSLLMAVMLIPTVALAKPQIAITITAAKELTEKVNGKVTKRLAPAQNIAPGDRLFYTVSYVNNGNETALNAVINDPIPKGTEYIADSASGQGAEITFSTDGGKTFAMPVKLTYEIKLPTGGTEKRVATPQQYTDIRWVVRSVPAGIGGELKFQVRVK